MMVHYDRTQTGRRLGQEPSNINIVRLPCSAYLWTSEKHYAWYVAYCKTYGYAGDTVDRWLSCPIYPEHRVSEVWTEVTCMGCLVAAAGGAE
jgi:hypothetical protein